MYLSKCLALIFSLMILGQAYLVRRYVGTWLFPACLFGLFWFGYTFFPLAILFWVPANPFAIALIFLCTTAFSVSSVPFDWKTAFKKNAQKCETTPAVYGGLFLRRVFYASTLLSVICLVLNSFAQGISLHDLIFDLFASAGNYAEMRYSESLVRTVFGPLSMICAYLGTILGGVLFSCVQARIERRLILVLSFLPSVFVALTQSSRGLLFMCIAYFLAGMLAYRVLAGKLHLIDKGKIKSWVVYALILVPTVTISFLTRGLYTVEDNRDVIRALIWYYISYAFGHIYAFSDWFSFIIGGHSTLTYVHEGATYGFYTFMPVFKLMGSRKVVSLGIFDEYYSYGDLLTSNIFTMFRGLITDFGIIGAVLFMLVIGLLLHKAFHLMLSKKRPVFTVAVFVFMVCFFYSSFGISLFMWNTVYVAFALLWIVLHINKRVSHMGDRRFAQPGLSAGEAMGPRSQLSGS
jgi:oligosaccharide repeat unit polymerase